MHPIRQTTNANTCSATVAISNKMPGTAKDDPCTSKMSAASTSVVKLSGNNPAGLERVVKLKSDDQPQSPDEAADEALRELTALIRRYDDEEQAYRSVVLTMWANRYGTYDDLARIKEWSASGVSGGDE